METYNGHVRTPQDAILLFEACRIGLLPRVQRRLSEKERQQIGSGSVFVWDEREAGMRRWTDGKSWSASRVSGSFLTYREMEGKRGGSFPTPTPAPKRASAKSPDGSATGSDGEGPDGYRYKADGLMKQSFSITTSNGQHLHLISYFSRAAAANLKQPTSDPQLRHIRPPKNMYPESSVNESQSVPPVTRGPMPGSPYAPSPHQMAPASPYSRGGPPPQQVYNAGYPPTPNGTPPAYYAYYGQPPLQYGPVIYAAPPYPPPVSHPLDGPPAPIRNPHQPYAMMAPHPGQPHFQGYAPHPHIVHAPHPMHPLHHGHQGPQYNGNPSGRPMPSAEHPPQHPQGSNYRQGAPAFPEQSVQLPAINGATSPQSRIENKPPTPQPSEIKAQASLSTLDANGSAANNAPSPVRTVPTLTLGSILNNHESDNDKNIQTNSRSGSRSPNSSQRPVRETPAVNIAHRNSKVTDENALSKLNKVMFVR